MALTIDGKTEVINALTLGGTQNLIVTYNVGPSNFSTSKTCSYGTAVDNGDGTVSRDITANVTFSIPANGEVVKVAYNDGTDDVATVTVTTENTFPNGGDYIVKSFKVTIG